MTDRIKFYELDQSHYNELTNREEYSFYKTTDDNVYLGDIPLSESSDFTAIEAILYANNWDSDKHQKIENSLIQSENNGIVGLSQKATEKEMEESAYSCLYVYDQSDGYITIAAMKDIPEIDIHITILVFTHSSYATAKTSIDILSEANNYTDNAIENGKAITFEVTLLANNWTDNTQTVYDNKFIVDGYAYATSPSGDGFEGYNSIRSLNITTDGEMTFILKEDEELESDLVINVLRVEVQD